MAASADEISIDQDGGLARARAFGPRRLKALLLLAQHPELDDLDWSGRVELHFGGKSVKGAVVAAAREIVE